MEEEWVTCSCDDYKMFCCKDCGVCTNCNGEYYMVHDEVWYSVNTVMNLDGMLCIGCLEARRGKLLTKDDFTGAPINFIAGVVGSTRLKNRLTDYAAAANF
jgi:hypothetical protein